MKRAILRCNNVRKEGLDPLQFFSMRHPCLTKGTDESRWCKECIPCQTSKVTRHTVPELREIPVPSRRFTEVNVDIVGPLPPSQGFRYLLTIIDRNTRWIEVAELQDISAPTVVSSFIRTWVARYGVPVTAVTDRGCQFTGVSIYTFPTGPRLVITRSQTG